MKFRLLIILTCLGLLLSACRAPGTGSDQPAMSPTQEAGKGAISGKIPNAAERWPDEPLTAYAASFAPVKGGGGMFTLEPYKAPQATLSADGSFFINNVPPGDYVLIIGPEPARAKPVVGDADQARVFTVESTVLQAGDLTLAR